MNWIDENSLYLVRQKQHTLESIQRMQTSAKANPAMLMSAVFPNLDFSQQLILLQCYRRQKEFQITSNTYPVADCFLILLSPVIYKKLIEIQLIFCVILQLRQKQNLFAAVL